MVRKKDDTHRFCIDYRQLNAVTKADTHPLPRIDDLLDQLGQCWFFSTLDLAAWYWQIRVGDTSREKTAFVTAQGLYEFRVMPFGLTNVPSRLPAPDTEAANGTQLQDWPRLCGSLH